MRTRKITIRIFEDDWQLLRRLYGAHGGYNVHIRNAVAHMCRRLRERLAEREREKEVDGGERS